MDKRELRLQLANRIAAADTVTLEQAGRVISQRLLNEINWNNYHRVSCYTANKQLREVATTSIIEQLRSRGIDVDEAPQERNAPLPRESYDAIIVPLLGFDNMGHRLGRGGGWYDRFLAQHPQACRIGLAYSIQRVSAVPTEQHDITLDAIITESVVINSGNISLNN